MNIKQYKQWSGLPDLNTLAHHRKFTVSKNPSNLTKLVKVNQKHPPKLDPYSNGETLTDKLLKQLMEHTHVQDYTYNPDEYIPSLLVHRTLLDRVCDE